MTDTQAHSRIEAAGGVLWRPAPDRSVEPGVEPGVEVALVHRPRYDDWSLPKGKLAAGEHVLAAAVREVEEETGFGCQLGQPLGELRYDKDGSPKRVRYWALRATGGAFEATEEVDDLRWVPPFDGGQLLAADRDRSVLTTFARRHVPTTPCLLVRHATAGERASFDGDDRERPLDERGQRQADALVGLLDLYLVQRVLSADVLRCLDTIRPYAVARQLAVESEPLVSESGYAEFPQTAVKRLVQIIAARRSTVVCSQGKSIPGLLTGVLRHFSADLPPDTSVRKAGFWALHVADGRVPRIVAAERFESGL